MQKILRIFFFVIFVLCLLFSLNSAVFTPTPESPVFQSGDEWLSGSEFRPSSSDVSVGVPTESSGSVGTNTEKKPRDLSRGFFTMEKDKTVVLETNQGNIEIKLFSEIAPKACENFVGLIEKGYYDGTIFHRVIKGFMIQGGDPTGTGRGGQSLWEKSFEDEVNTNLEFDKPGLSAMANAGPNTNGSQFFITVAPTPWLNMHHTIFGEVISGYDVVQKIENTQTGPADKPLQEQKIIRAYVK